jgi:iron(III) transport system substrate-binding protein
MRAIFRAFNLRKLRVRTARGKRLLLTTLCLAPMAAQADGTLNVICSVQVEWCTAMKNEFEKMTGTKVNLTQKGTGEALAQIAAEKANPKLDIWIGGTGDPHLQAAEQDLTLSYKSAALSQLHEWARRQAEQSNYRTVGIYAGALGFGYNSELLAKKKLTAPACWKDLLKAEYKDEIQVANPNSSGTAYVAIATLVQLMGEEEAFKYLRSLHKNVNQYTRSGTGPIKAVARGETSVSISFIHDGVTEAIGGFPVKVATPCEGTGYEIGSMSIVKGARNLDNAKRWYDWALTPEAQKLAAEAKQFQLPSNVASALPPRAPKFSEIKLIDYDFAKYGSSAERKRLIERWDREIGGQPK